MADPRPNLPEGHVLVHMLPSNIEELKNALPQLENPEEYLLVIDLPKRVLGGWRGFAGGVPSKIIGASRSTAELYVNAKGLEMEIIDYDSLINPTRKKDKKRAEELKTKSNIVFLVDESKSDVLNALYGELTPWGEAVGVSNTATDTNFSGVAVFDGQDDVVPEELLEDTGMVAGFEGELHAVRDGLPAGMTMIRRSALTPVAQAEAVVAEAGDEVAGNNPAPGSSAT